MVDGALHVSAAKNLAERAIELVIDVLAVLAVRLGVAGLEQLVVGFDVARIHVGEVLLVAAVEDPRRHRGIETVFQGLAVSPALDIASNIFLGRELRMPGIAASPSTILFHSDEENAGTRPELVVS